MSIEPVYFGERDLFGLYRAPLSDALPRRHLIVICNAAFHEYFKTQFVARQLGKKLAAIGYDVFRFDYGGQGNSGGGLAEFTWMEDVSAAIEEGKAISGAMHTSLIGFRMGALLAANYKGQLHSLAMWDPISDGNILVSELRQVQARLVAMHHGMQKEDRAKIGPNELVGYQIGDDMLKSIEELELDWSKVSASRVCLIESQGKGDHGSGEYKGDVARLEEEFLCQWELPSSRLLLAHGVVTKIVDFMR